MNSIVNSGARGFGLLSLLLALGVIASSPAFAAETVIFTYDALGRLTTSATSGGVNTGLNIAVTIDPADNRTAKIITNAPAGGLPDVSAIVLPINGYTIIPVLTTP